MLALFSASPALRVPPPVMRVQFEAYKLSGIDAVVSGNSPGWKSSGPAARKQVRMALQMRP